MRARGVASRQIRRNENTSATINRKPPSTWTTTAAKYGNVGEGHANTYAAVANEIASRKDVARFIQRPYDAKREKCLHRARFPFVPNCESCTGRMFKSMTVPGLLKCTLRAC